MVSINDLSVPHYMPPHVRDIAEEARRKLLNSPRLDDEEHEEIEALVLTDSSHRAKLLHYLRKQGRLQDMARFLHEARQNEMPDVPPYREYIAVVEHLPMAVRLQAKSATDPSGFAVVAASRNEAINKFKDVVDSLVE